MFRHLVIQSAVQIVKKTWYNQLLFQFYDVAINPFVFLDIPEENIHFTGENKIDPVYIYKVYGKDIQLSPNSEITEFEAQDICRRIQTVNGNKEMIMQQPYVRFAQSCIDCVEDQTIVQEICKNVKYCVVGND